MPLSKRLFDLTLALIAGLLLALPALVITLWILIRSGRPVFYVAERMKTPDQPFRLWKFRTMTVSRGESGVSGGDKTARITPEGRILRRYRLDEIPQIWNILRGDMSIVGPRPPIPYEVESYESWHRKRLDMKPGMTGLWQVSGRNRLTFEEMVKIDLFYIENWSLWFDLKIILLTLPAVFRGDGAR